MPQINSGAAYLLRGIASCGKTVIGDALRQQEAAIAIQQAWKSGRKATPPVRKKRRVSRSRGQNHWFWGAFRSCGRLDRAAAAKLMLEELRASNDVSLKIRFIRMWSHFEYSDHPTEWAAILQEVISMLPENDVLAICKDFLWSLLCRFAATSPDSNAAAAYSSIITSLAIQTDSEESKEATVLRNKELLWKNEDDYANLLRAWHSFPTLFGDLVDPETSCCVLQNKVLQDEDEFGGKPNECVGGTDTDEEVELPANDGDEHEVEDNNNEHVDRDEDGDVSCGEEHDEDEDEEDEDDEDHDIDDVSSGGSGDEMIVDAEDLQEITIRESEINVAEQIADDEVKTERDAFIVRATMKVLRDLYSEIILQELLDVVKPPAKPSQIKILLRRSPSQEEYFRGSISHNPIDVDMLQGPDPTVDDLRQYIAKELQMADSVELIEVLVANQILSPGLKLRVVNQVVWKQHLIDGNGSGAVFSSGTISILWTTSRRVTSSTPVSALPPMVATYRLIGVDGEATEDTVETLQDPEEDNEGPSDEEIRKIALLDPLVVFRSTDVAMKNLIVRIQRDKVDNGPACGDSIPPALALFKHSCIVHAETFVREGAPTALLQYLLRLFQVSKDCCAVTNMLQSLIELLTTDISLASENVEKQRKQLSSLLDAIDKLDLPVDLCERVANLLPFLTYGQPSLSRELAQHINRHIDVDVLGQSDEKTLTKTLIQMIIHLPSNDSCDKLRTGLLDCGLGRRLASRLLQGFPSSPPPWTTALWKKNEDSSASVKMDDWKQYYDTAPFISLLLKLMTGLGRIAASSGLVTALHWLESTSDCPELETRGLGLLSETLLDNLVQVGDSSKQKIVQVRRTTRQRKKEIAMEKRSRALAKLTSGNSNIKKYASGLSLKKGDIKKGGKAPVVPDWMAEADKMIEESGLTCAVCQEGRSLQPQELLGLYAYVTKVSLANDKCGSKDAIAGTQLLKRLPSSLPPSLHGSVLVEDWFSSAKAISSDLVLLTSNRRTTTYTTSVSAGTGIHFSCHRRARAVDRNHAKAPKSEWSGAALRNNRVSCNIMIPLVSPLMASHLPIGAVEGVLAEYHSCVANSLGAMPPSMLWSTLYDVYFLLLRIAYNEDLSTDCGGGSLASNCELLYYQFIAADAFDRDAQAENMAYSAHARCLPNGLLSAMVLINEDGASYNALAPFVGDAAPMSAICSVVFNNCTESSGSQLRPFPKRQWVLGRDFFLRALIICAGRRHFMGIKDSGVLSEGARRVRDEDLGFDRSNASDSQSVDVISPFVRPMLILFGVIDHMSADFSPSMTDEEIRDSTQRLVTLLADCRRTRSITELSRRLHISCRNDDFGAYFNLCLTR